MKRSAATCQDQAKIDDINMKWDTRSGGSMFEHKARETKIVKTHEGEINSKIEDGPREMGTLCASGTSLWKHILS